MFKVGDTVIHKKTGGEYVVLSTPTHRERLEYCDETFYRYIRADVADTTVWLRRTSEMEDGRFEKVARATKVMRHGL